MNSRIVLCLLMISAALTMTLPAQAQVEPFLGEIRFVGFNFAPVGWALCNGQLINIRDNTALFALLGTQYGGDGRNTFALPDLQGRVAIGAGNGAGLTPRVNGQEGGQEAVTLTIPQMPKHTHNLKAVSGAADSTTPAANLPANSATTPVYSTKTADTTMRSSIVATTGNNQPHENMQPFTTMTCIIALEGIFPSRN